ncbi:MAG: MFS transporter, partial [Pseudomonadota bacterium]
GIPFGIMVAYMSGAFFASGGAVNWRAAFVVIGFLGLPLAFIVKRTLPEPERGRQDGPILKPLPFAEAVGRLARIPSYWTMAFGIAFASFGSYSINAFLMIYIRQAFPEVPLVPLLIGLGAGNAVFYATGTYLGGVIADHFGKASVAAYGFVPAVTVGLASSAIGAAWLAEAPSTFFALLAMFIFFIGFYLGPSFSVAQNLAGVSVRATSTAIFFFVLNLVALGAGPSVTGLLSDTFAASMGSPLEGLRRALLFLMVPYALSVSLFMVSAILLPRDWKRARGAIHKL